MKFSPKARMIEFTINDKYHSFIILIKLTIFRTPQNEITALVVVASTLAIANPLIPMDGTKKNSTSKNTIGNTIAFKLRYQ